MENYRTIVSLAHIKELRKQGDYAGAYEIVKDINLKKVRDVSDCNMIADVCNENGDYERSLGAYDKIYKKSGSKHALSSLVYLNIKTEKTEKARELLTKYEQVAPRDPKRLIYRYRIEKLEKAPYPERIATLEKWKNEEYTERWALELAKLYYKAGNEKRCIEECDSIMNYFGDGEYVDWAKALKAHLQGEIDLRNASGAEIAKTVGRTDDVTELIPDMGATTLITPIRDVPEPEETESAAEELKDREEFAAENAFAGENETEAVTGAESEPVQTETAFVPEEEPVKKPKKRRSRKKAAERREQENEAAAEPAEPAPAFTEPEEAFTPEIPAAEPDYDFTADLAAAVAAVQDEMNGGRYEETKQPENPVKADESIEVREVEAASERETQGAAEAGAKDDYEIEAMQGFMKFLEENSSATVKLREQREPVTEIGGVLGERLKSGEAVLEDYFGNYARIDSVRKQLIRSLEVLFDPLKRGGSIIITGGRKTGKTTLAKKIAKTLNKFGVTESKKALIVTAEKLNKVNLASQREKLAGCTVIVEKAGGLSKDTVSDLIGFCAGHAESSLVFLEDDRKSMNELMRDYPEVGSVFNNRIHLPQEYRLEELKGFIYEYLVNTEYELEVNADRALDEKLAKIMALKPESPIDSAIAIAKTATEAAEARNSELLVEMMNNGQIENADIMTVKAEDI